MNNRKRSTRIANIILIIASFVFCLILAEIAIRVLFSKPEYSNRFLFWSSPHLILDKNGAVRYLPDDTVRKISVYGKKIEYDLIYHTNNMGFIDTVNYKSPLDINKTDRHFALVGDSITAGSGASAWVPILREQMQSTYNSVEFYNLGISGAGIEQFYKLLKSVSHDIEFTDIIIIAISNDFQRPMWRPLTTSSEIRFCPFEESDEVCSKRIPVARVVDFDITEEKVHELVENIISMRIELEAAENINDDSTPFTWLVRNSRLLDLSYSLYHGLPLFAAGERKQRVSAALKRIVVNKNIQVLEKIRDQFPAINIHFLHLPERHEVSSGSYDREIREHIEQLEIKYFPTLQQCNWSEDMFHLYDLHPNDKGYENITRCVKDYISHSIMEPSSGRGG